MSSMRRCLIFGVPLKTQSFISTLHVRFLNSFVNDIGTRLKKVSVSRIPFCATTKSYGASTGDPSYPQRMVISNFILAHDKAEPETWSTLKKELSQFSENGLNDANIDFVILNRCLVLRKKLPLARSYLNYMRHLTKKIDGAVACEFLKLCYSCRTSLEEEDFERIISFTHFLRRKYTNIDSYIGEGIIKGLILQNKIDDCLQTLGKIKEWDKVNERIYSAIITYSIENNHSEGLRDLILEFAAQYPPLSKKLCYTWIEHFSNSRTQLDELLTIFRLLSHIPEKKILDNLLKSYLSLPGPGKLHGEYGIITDNGLCSVCGESLNRIEVSDDEFKTLKKSFMNNVLVGPDVYTHTKPYELKKFHTLMDLHGPFKIIIDGLNVGYHLGSSGQPSSYVRGIEKVFTQLRHRKPHDKMMFIGKWHMRKWPGLLDMIRHFGARYFFVENDSADDMYIICAALYSGAFLVSNDALGKEKLRLNQELFNLFERWRQSSVISVIKHADEVVELSFPFPFEKVVQSTINGGWHVPYQMQSDRSQFSEVLQNWLCLKSPESM